MRVAFIAPNASHLLHGRRLAVSIGSPDTAGYDITDIWVLEHRRLVNVSNRVREDSGADRADPFSLSPDGKYIAFFLQTATRGACGDCQPVLYIMRSDGSQVRSLGANLLFAGASSLWAPSWDRSGQSFVIAATKTGIDPDTRAELNEVPGDEDTGIFRFAVPSGKETQLTRPGIDKYDYAEPEVSPNGRKIAFLRSVAPEPSNFWRERDFRGNPDAPEVAAFVYVMGADGKATTRLPLPPRTYASLWWCGNSATLCVDSPTKNSALSANTYRVDLLTGTVDHLQDWAEAVYAESGALSADGTFAIEGRHTRRGAEVLAGAVGANGEARFAPVLAAAHERGNPFFGLSVSGP